jgi:hypothetical protein
MLSELQKNRLQKFQPGTGADFKDPPGKTKNEKHSYSG